MKHFTRFLTTLLLCCGISFAAMTASAQDANTEAQPSDDDAAADDKAAKTAQELIQQAYKAAGNASTFEEYDDVVELCEAALAKEPDESGRRYLMELSAWALNRRGKELSKQATEADDVATAKELEAKAMADFQEAVVRDPDKWQAIHNRGVSYALMGEYDKALDDFKRTIKLNPNYTNAYFNRGEIHYENGDYPAAIRDYTQVIRLKPDDAGAYAARAHAYYNLGRYQNALADFDKAVQLAPQDAALRTDRGDVYAHTGQWQKAAADYRAAVELDGDYARAHMGAAWVMATSPDEEFRDAESAIEAAEKAVDLAGEDDWRYLDTLAAAYANAGDFDKAQTALKKALSKAPESQKSVLQARLSLYAEGKPFRDTVRSGQ